jgi:hypothetical protein
MDLLLPILAALRSGFSPPGRRAAGLLREHGREGAVRAAQEEMEFAANYGAPGDVEYWQEVLLVLAGPERARNPPVL